MRNLLEYIKIIFVLFIFIVGVGLGGYIENHYTMYGYATTDGNNTIVVDERGEEWIFENYSTNGNVKIYFHNNFTDNTRYDDIILKIKDRN